MAPQLLGRPAGELADGFAEVFQRGHRATKRPCASDFLFVWCRVLQIHTGLALQLTHRALQHHRPALAYRGQVHAGEIKHRVDTTLFELRRNATAHAPDFLDR